MAGTSSEGFSINFRSKRKSNSSIDPRGSLSAQSQPSTLDPDVARCLFEEGAFFIFLDVPERTEFGIDVSSWNVGDKFKGVKLIPPGVHFVYFRLVTVRSLGKECASLPSRAYEDSAVSKDNLTAPRTGFFHNFRSREVLVRRWDTKYEGILPAPVSPEEVERISINLKNLDPFLGAYPYEAYKKWVSMSKWITEKTIQRLAPFGPNACIFSVQQLESLPFVGTHAKDASVDEGSSKKQKISAETSIPEMKVVEGSRIRFSNLDTKSSLSNMAPSEVTKLSMDQSTFVEFWIREGLDGEENEVFGELQFSFVCFFVGQVYDAFEQWKKLVALLCRCERLTKEKQALFLNFISVLYFQLQEIPKDFFVDIVSRENFLTITLQSFFAIVEDSDGIYDELKRKSAQFRKYLQKFFKWDFSLEANEDAPVVVAL